MEVIKDGWVEEKQCYHCGARVRIFKGDLFVQKGIYAWFVYAKCAVCGGLIPVIHRNLPPAVVRSLENWERLNLERTDR